MAANSNPDLTLAPRPGASRRPLALAAGCALLAVCALMAGAGVAGFWVLRARASAPAGPPNVEYVLDASPRMLDASEGGNKLTVAQGVLAEILRPASAAVSAGLRVFGTGAVAAGQLSSACQDTDLLVPLAPANQTRIADRLGTVQGGAGVDSALGVALIAAIRDLAATRGRHSLVVVTGGADSCNPQAGQLVAQEASRQHIQLQVFVVGFEVTSSDGLAIKGVVDQMAGATYLEAANPAALRQDLAAIQSFVEQPSRVTVAQVLATAGAVAAVGPTSGGPTPTVLNTGLLQMTVLGYAGQPAESGVRLNVSAFSHQDHQSPLAVDYNNPAALRLPPGLYDVLITYEVTAGSPFIGGRVEQWVNGLSIQAGLTTTQSYDLQLGQVDLTVLEAAGKPVPDGNYGFGFRVFHPDNLNSAVAWVIVTSTATLQLAPGTYVLQTQFPGAELNKQDPAAVTFEVKTGQSLPYTFDLKLGRLSVEVDDASGQPLPGAQVNANAYSMADPTTLFAYSYSANPADLPLQAGTPYNVVLKLNDNRQLALPVQQVPEGQTQPLKVNERDFK